MSAPPAKYDRLASIYDQRWSTYLAASLGLARAHLFVNPGQTLLDIGCGTGQLLADVLDREPDVRAVGLDLSTGMLEEARRRLPRGTALVQGVADRVPLANASCDWVVSTSALHYVANVPDALREIARVLKPGGHLLVVDWCADDPLMRALALWARLRDRTFVRLFRASELVSLVREQGFVGARVRQLRAGGWYLMAVTARRG